MNAEPADFFTMIGRKAARVGAVATAVGLAMAAIAWVGPLVTGEPMPVHGLDRMSPMLRPLYEDPRRIVSLMVVGSLLLLVSGVGLAKGRKWGRLAATVWMGLAAAWMIYGLAARPFGPADFGRGSGLFRMVWYAAELSFFLIGVAILAGFAFVAKRLWSRESRDVFS